MVEVPEKVEEPEDTQQETTTETPDATEETESTVTTEDTEKTDNTETVGDIEKDENTGNQGGAETPGSMLPIILVVLGVVVISGVAFVVIKKK